MKKALNMKLALTLSIIFSLVMVGLLRVYPHSLFSAPYTNWLELIIGTVVWSAVFMGAYLLIIYVSSKNQRTGKLLNIVMVILAAGFAAILIFGPGNVSLEYSDRYGHSYENKDVSFVFTEPFSSLSNFDNAFVIKKISAPEGDAQLFLLPGKYGLYMEKSNGTKVLYENLKIDNAKNNSPIGDQGPWYVDVGFGKNDFIFGVDYPQ